MQTEEVPRQVGMKNDLSSVTKKLEACAGELVEAANSLMEEKDKSKGRWPERVLRGEVVKFLEITRNEKMHRRDICPDLGISDATWAMSCDLYLAFLKSEERSVTSVCLASGHPATTALRWLGVLEEHSMVRRVRSTFDRRVVIVELTPEAIEQIGGWIRWIYRKLDEQ